MENVSENQPKLWTKSQGPVRANASDTRKASAINMLLIAPAPVLPMEEGDPVLPFVIGIFEVMRNSLLPDVGAVRLRRAIAAYARSKNYLLASAQPDAMRHDMGGTAIAPVSDKDRLTAQLRVQDIRRERQARAAEAPKSACNFDLDKDRSSSQSSTSD